MAKAPKKNDRRFTWSVVSVIVVALTAAIGGTWYYATYVQPKVFAEQVARWNVEACQTFRDGVNASSKQTNFTTAQETLMTWTTKALDTYHPKYDSHDPAFGAVFDQLMQVSEAGYGRKGNAQANYADLQQQLQNAVALCQPILAANTK